jgi:type I restriction enzyme, S subunit
MKRNWEIKKLSDVCTFINGRAYNKQELLPTGKYPVLRVGNFFTNNHWYYSNLELNEDKYCDNGDLLYAWSASFGPKIWDGDKVIYHYHIWKVIPDTRLITKEFLHLLLQWDAEKLKADHGTGTTMMHVSKGSMEARAVPIPPLPEQQHIVSVLDEAFAAIARGKAIAEQNLKRVKQVFESYLQEIFQKPLHNWDVCNLEDHIKLIDYRGRTPVKTNSGVRLITAKNIKLGYLQLEPQEFIGRDNYDSWMSRGIPKFGDVIFTTEAPLANVAQIETEEKLAFAQRVIVMQPNRNRLDPTFLKFMLLSNPIRSNILSKGTGATVLGIKSSLLKKIEIYFPKAIKEQQEIVQKLNALSVETKKLEIIYERKLSSLEELKKSILQKAFKGELKTTEPIPA